MSAENDTLIEVAKIIAEPLKLQAQVMVENMKMSQATMRQNAENFERARIAHESSMAVNAMALQERERRVAAAERAEQREDERIRLAQQFERLTAAAEDRSAEKHELLKVMAHLAPPDHIPDDMFQTTPPDDPTHEEG